MIAPAVPSNDAERIAALHALHLLETPHEERFDRITRLAARVFAVPIVLVSLVDQNRQWLKSCIGLPDAEMSRNISFCAHAILGEETLVIPDARLDPRFAENPLVTREPCIRFYAGHLLRSRDGQKLGTLCILDRQPRDLTEQDLQTLRDLALIVENEINTVEVARALDAQRASEARVRAIMDDGVDAIITVDEQGVIESFNAAAEGLFGYQAQEVIGQPATLLIPKHDPEGIAELLSPAARSGKDRWFGKRRELTFRRRDGGEVVLELGLSAVQLREQRLFIVVMHDISERKRAEEALRESEQRFRQLAENIDQVFWIAEADSMRRIYVSPAYERVWGRSRDNLLRDPSSFLEAIHPDDRERVRAAQEQQRQGTYNEEYRIVHAHGEVRWIWARAFPIVNEHGEVYRIAGIAQDITERKRAEEAQTYYRAIIEASGDAIIGKTLDGVIVSWNPAAERIYGYTAADVQGASLSLLVPSNKPDELRALLARIRQGERVEQYETKRVRKDGTLVTVSLTISPIRDTLGQITGAATIARDITAQKQGVAALRASEERFRLLFEHSPDGIWLLDGPAPDGSLTILECNSAAAAMHGYTRDELIGQPIGMFVVLPDDPERFRRDARGQENFLRDGVKSGEDQHRRKDGTLITIEYVAQRVTLDGQELVLAVERDITAYKHAEEDRERLIHELQFARDLAEQASRAKSEFLSNMSHELRTPLFTILGYAELMTSDRPKPEHQEYLTYISAAGDHLLALVNDLLDLSRIEAGGTTMLLQPTTIAPVVHDSVQLIRRQAAERGLSVHVQHGPDEQVLADPQRLHQVLVNLLSNAVKYNVDGGQMSMTWTRSDGRVRISVHDTGPGIPASLVPRLFTPFERLGADKSAVPGSGLGLALSKQLVEGMGGTIGVESEEGQGTTFWVELPGTS